MKVEELLEDLHSRLNIVDVVADYIELKRAGQNYKGLCPFHSEKTPSFMVSPDKQIFHCFGCGVGGNVIHFVMKFENLPFQEAVRLLARKAGIDLKEYKYGRDNESTREKLIEIHRQASRAFAENLTKSKKARSYLSERGLSEETIRLFSLGYALKDWHYLSDILRKKGFPDSLIFQSGIVTNGEKGAYDTFRDRIIFPICEAQGDVIAFGGRVMDESQPKYLNSPESPLFKKGETLYGIHLAKDALRKTEYALIVEGYFDVIVCHQNGFGNAMAPLGTALTQGHLQQLRRFTKRVVLVFDGDEAGKAAAKRSIPLLFEQGFIVKVLLLPEHDDPDSFLRKNGPSLFREKLSGARSALDFILKVSQKDKTETVHEAVGMISLAKDPIMREELVSELSVRAGIRETVIREEIKKLQAKQGAEERKKGPSPTSPLGPASLWSEELLLLSAAVTFPERCDDILRVVPIERFRNPVVREVLRKLRAANGRVESVLPMLSDEEKMVITGLTLNPGFDLETVNENIEDCIRKMMMRAISERIKEAEGKGDPGLLNALHRERRECMREAAPQKTRDA